MDDAPVTETRLRLATPADVDALARLHVQAFNETHGPGPSIAMRGQQWRDAFLSDERQWFCLVVETSEGRLVGFAKGQPYADESHGEYRGELNKIYLLREYQGRGLGRRLVCAVGREMLSRGIDSMVLFGEARSPSNGFYERMGAARLFAPSGEFHGGYGWKALAALLMHCEGVP